METTLGLPHGFFDQPHPQLAPDTIARLKSPLAFVQTDADPEESFETSKPVFAAKGSQPQFLKDRFPEESEMPEKANDGTPSPVKNRRNATASQSSASNSIKGVPAKNASPKTSRQQSLALNDVAAIQDIRRANLHVLTARNGSKVRLGVVMQLTGSNMAHRLHGKKRMDDAEANRFTERLGLPTGWLDTPRAHEDIPESVSRLLLPASRKKASAPEQRSITHVDNSPVSATVSHERETPLISEDNAGATSAEHASPARAESNASDSAVLEQIPQAPVPQLHTAPHASTSVTSLGNLEGLEPIAEALIKTLAGKARTGRLDELKALELLQQAVLL
ncbi:hypothetical protein [Caballeronia calidae]